MENGKNLADDVDCGLAADPDFAGSEDTNQLNSVKNSGRIAVLNYGGTVSGPITVNQKNENITINLNDKHDGNIGSFRFDRTIPSVLASREVELGALRAMLTKNQERTSEPQIAIVHGIGGVGKSTLTRWYAVLNEGEFVNFIWIDAQRVEAIGEAFRSIWVSRLEEKHIESDSDSDVAEKVFQRLLKHKTLIVFDNTENGEDIEPFLPKGSPASNATVIATTRVTAGWSSRLSNLVQLHNLTSDVCKQYIRENLATSPILVPDIDTVLENGRPGWRSLAEEFDHLIIGVQSATNAIVQRNRLHHLLGEKNECYTIQNLLDLLKSTAIPPQIPNPEHPQEITCAPLRKLWAATLAEMEKNPHGLLPLKILNVCSFLSPAGISKDWLRLIFSDFSKEELSYALNFLHNWSLGNVQGDKLIVHRLLQKTMMTRFEQNSSDDLKAFLQWLLPQVIKLQRHLPNDDLSSTFAFSSSFTWLLQNLQPHANLNAVMEFVFSEHLAVDYWSAIRPFLVLVVQQAATGKLIIDTQFYAKLT